MVEARQIITKGRSVKYRVVEWLLKRQSSFIVHGNGKSTYPQKLYLGKIDVASSKSFSLAARVVDLSGWVNPLPPNPRVIRDPVSHFSAYITSANVSDCLCPPPPFLRTQTHVTCLMFCLQGMATSTSTSTPTPLLNGRRDAEGREEGVEIGMGKDGRREREVGKVWRFQNIRGLL